MKTLRVARPAGSLIVGICAQKGLEGYQMNARMNKAEYCQTNLYLISPEVIGGLQAGTWIKFQRALERVLLLLGSPIASLRWAVAKRRVRAGKKAMNGKCHRSSSLAECERDGIVMGF
jgi:hypothetical protein